MTMKDRLSQLKKQLSGFSVVRGTPAQPGAIMDLTIQVDEPQKAVVDVVKTALEKCGIGYQSINIFHAAPKNCVVVRGMTAPAADESAPQAEKGA